MNNPNRISSASAPDDPLLAAFDRLATSQRRSSSPHVSTPSDKQRHKSRPVAQQPLAHLIVAPNVRRAEPLIPVSHVDQLEVIERATGLGRSGDADVAAVDKLLQWIKSGSVEPADVFKSIVAGSSPSDSRFNSRVLAVLSWLCVLGGPVVLPAAVSVTNPRKPMLGVRVCLDVLRSLGHDPSSDDLLYDDNRIRQMKFISSTSKDLPLDVLPFCEPNPSDLLMAAAVETYAIVLGRKFIFHSRYPEVESNYSLDRFFRRVHIENHADPVRHSTNEERHSLVISKVALSEIAMIAHGAAVAADRLEHAHASCDIIVLVIGEACNAYALSEYMRSKLAVPVMGHFDLESTRFWLSRRLRMMQDRGGPDLRRLKHYVDANVFRVVTSPKSRPSRPESRHRRDIMCTFTSFQAMHKALVQGFSHHRSPQ